MARVTDTLKLSKNVKIDIYIDYSYSTTAIKFRPAIYFAVTGENNYKKREVKIWWWNSKSKKQSYSKSVQNSWTMDWHTNSDYSVSVTVSCEGKSKTLTLTSNIKPAKPKISAKRISDYNIRIGYSGTGYKAVPVRTLTIQRQTDDPAGAWDDVTTISLGGDTNGYSGYYNDVSSAIERGHRYRFRVTAGNQAGGSGWVYTGWVYAQAPDISEVAHTRSSNTKNVVRISKSGRDLAYSLITSYRVERSQNGGAWTWVATAKPGAASDGTLYVEDKKCQPNCYYRYRVRPTNPGGTSVVCYPSRDGTDTTYNTPAAPSAIKGTFNASGFVNLAITNPARTATALELQRSTDLGVTWTTIAEIDETDGPVKAYIDDTPISGTSVQYRARNLRDSLDAGSRYSAWSKVSAVVGALKKPNAPTLTSPVQGYPVTMDNESALLTWVHNPQDGTAQTAAEVQYRVQGESNWSTATVAAAQYYELPLAGFAANDVIEWCVRTKGEHASYSDYSAASIFILRALPVIAWTAPANKSTVENLPLSLSWDYEDLSGALDVLTLEIIQDDERVFSAQIPTEGGESGSYTYSLADYLFENGESYQLDVTALSSTGLQDTDSIGISVDYQSVRLASQFFADPDLDEDTGFVEISIGEDVTEEAEDDPDAPEYVDSPVEKAYLYRVYEKERVLLASDVKAGDQIVDKYAPLNVDYQYELLEVAQSGQIAIMSVTVNNPCDYWFVYWTDKTGAEQVASAIWNPSGDVKFGRPEKKQIRYSGRRYPVSYDSAAIEETFGFSGVVTERTSLEAFRQMMRDGGRGIWKSGDGDVYKADFEFGYSSDYTYNQIRWEISLDVTRIDSEEL